MKFDPNKETLGVDVDLTTLQSDHAWWFWLCTMAEDHNLPYSISEFVRQGNKLDYDLSSHFPPMKNENVDPFDFWRQEGVYDWILPVDGAKWAINDLMKYYNIVFVTHNKGNGGRSKFNNLDRLFGKDNFSYVVTREKYLVKMNYMIDDRNDFLNACAKNGITSIKIETPHRQLEKTHRYILEMEHWYEIHSFLINKHKEKIKKAS